MKVFKAPYGFTLEGRTFLQTSKLNESVRWCEGKCRLSIKRGKKRKLIKGVIDTVEHDCPMTGLWINWFFSPATADDVPF